MSGTLAEVRERLLRPLTDEEAEGLRLVTAAELDAAMREGERDARPMRARRWPCR